MARKKSENGKTNNKSAKVFNIEYMNAAQKLAWIEFQRHDVIFLTGVSGTGKTHLAIAHAVGEILAKKKKKIVLTRPIVESGEKLGYLPGSFAEKTDPYMMPLWDILENIVPPSDKERIYKIIEVAPLAFLRGRTFNNSVCVFDEAQNATKGQFKLFLTRLGKNSKMIITGDPKQSDLDTESVAMVDVISRLQSITGVAIVDFQNNQVVRHPLVAKILEKLEQ